MQPKDRYCSICGLETKTVSNPKLLGAPRVHVDPLRTVLSRALALGVKPSHPARAVA